MARPALTLVKSAAAAAAEVPTLGSSRPQQSSSTRQPPSSAPLPTYLMSQLTELLALDPSMEGALSGMLHTLLTTARARHARAEANKAWLLIAALTPLFGGSV